MTKKYISLSKLSTFLDNLSNRFSVIGHKHKISDISDFSGIIEVDSELSSTSNNPVANSVLDAEFEAIANSMNALDAAIDNKVDIANAVTVEGGATLTMADIFGAGPYTIEFTDEEEEGGVGGSSNYVETDPTVPAWAKAPNKPTYTASEVGAVTMTEVNTAIEAAFSNIARAEEVEFG